MNSHGSTCLRRSGFWAAGLVVLCGAWQTDVFPAPSVPPSAPTASQGFGLRFVDPANGRGIPLVEVESVSHQRLVTDNAGWIYLQEPGWTGQLTYLHVRSHGYALPKDGFGYAGIRVTPEPGGRKVVDLPRTQIAERLYRVTGEDLYRDSVLLGEPTPLAQPLGTAEVVGQDSVQFVPAGDRWLWFWGDTSRRSYPLGQFRTSGAWSLPPGGGGLDPTAGIDLHYWTNKSGFSREMVPLEPGEEGVVWIDGVTQVPDAQNRLRIVAHYSRRKGLAEPLDHGFCVWDDARARFERIRPLLPNQESWRFLHGHPVRHAFEGREYLLCGDNVLNVRVPATLEAILDPQRYEAWSCHDTPKEPATTPTTSTPPRRRPDGLLDYAWRKDAPPVTPADEKAWLAQGSVKPDELRSLPRDTNSDAHPEFHRGSVRWNRFRQRWIAIMTQIGGSSVLGEVWYSESPSPLGPWAKAVKIATHDRYSFYNPVHHAELDQGEGRWILFEGTYVNTFSGNPDTTPRYDYNQVMYRLDLADPRLTPAQTR